MTQEIMVVQNDFMPAMTVQDAISRRNTIIQFVKDVMDVGVDYGTIPGTSKDTLLKAGAEKLCTLFGLSASFQLADKEEDWTGEHHNGEPFFYYRYKTLLSRNGVPVGDGEGSCNSWEKKYRWRDSQRLCPSCGKPTIIKGKQEYGGGWLCFAKKGGCGAKFADDAQEIVSQQVGRVKNEDIFDIVNTIQKMAQKRALVAATLVAVNASEFFTQDVEDMEIIEGNYEFTPIAETLKKTKPQPQPKNPKPPAQDLKSIIDRYNSLVVKAQALGIDTDKLDYETQLSYDEIKAMGLQLKEHLDAVEAVDVIDEAAN